MVHATLTRTRRAPRAPSHLPSLQILLLQLCLAPLRDGAALLALQKELRANGHDLDAWRNASLLADRCDFTALDAPSLLLPTTSGWDLACRLVCPRTGGKRGARLSAADALRHPFLLADALAL